MANFNISIVLSSLVLLMVSSFTLAKNYDEYPQSVANKNAVELNQDWEQFKSEHGKWYGHSATEEAKRKALFLATDAFIKEHNSNPNATFKLKHNKFSDMTKDEKKRFKSYSSSAFTKSKAAAITRQALAPSYSTATLAANVDWRNDYCMQPVADQGETCNCWAFAAIAVLEFNNCVKYGKKIALSQQQLVDCNPQFINPATCNEDGDAYYGWEYIAKVGGIQSLASYPYRIDGSDGPCKFNKANVAAKVSTTNPAFVIDSGDTAKMMEILNSKQLLAVSISSETPAYDQYSSGIFTDTSCNKIETDHQLTAVGYGTDSATGLKYWILRNSFGPTWGLNGYFLIQRGVNLCHVEELAVYTNVA